MKKEIKATILASILAVGIIGGTAIAQTGNDTTMMPQQSMRGNMMGNQGMMGGRGMMGGNMMGGNMMGGRGMMGGMGMMDGGMMGTMGQGHMGCMKMMSGGMMPSMTPEDQQKFMDDTREMRKKMHSMRFEYMEAARNPKTTLGDLTDMEQKMLDTRKEMIKKAEKYQNKQ